MSVKHRVGVQKPAELGMPMADLIRRECRADPLSLDEAVDRLGIGTGLRTVTTPGRVRAAPTRRVAEPFMLARVDAGTTS